MATTTTTIIINLACHLPPEVGAHWRRVEFACGVGSLSRA
jgi:hypothetical protein